MLWFNDLNIAITYANSEELKAAMMKSGVANKAEIWFTADVERTSF
jgi:hypothetical protein